MAVTLCPGSGAWEQLESGRTHLLPVLALTLCAPEFWTHPGCGQEG